MNFISIDQKYLLKAVEIVNSAYEVDEAGLWCSGFKRTSAKEIEAVIERKALFGLTSQEDLLAVVQIELGRPDEFKINMLSVDVSIRETISNIPSILFQKTHEYIQALGAKTITLDLLVPVHWEHPKKQKLLSWYYRLGYEVIDEVAFDTVVENGSHLLVTECKFLVMKKEVGIGPLLDHFYSFNKNIANKVISGEMKFCKVKGYIYAAIVNDFVRYISESKEIEKLELTAAQFFPFIARVRGEQQGKVNLIDELRNRLELDFEQSIELGALDLNLSNIFTWSKERLAEKAVTIIFNMKETDSIYFVNDLKLLPSLEGDLLFTQLNFIDDRNILGV